MIMNLKQIFGKSYKTLNIISDSAGWVLDCEAKELQNTACKLGISTVLNGPISLKSTQSVYHTSHFDMLDPEIYKGKCRLAFDYFHGLPQNEPVFDECFKTLCKYHTRIARIRVSQSQIYNLVLSSGIDSSKVFRIPIGINLNYFKHQKPTYKNQIRQKLGIPEHAVVVGSFQKDGVGWEEGLEPKLIKGPDVFLKTLAVLKTSIPDLWVLLTGPARGFVKVGLEKLGISYTHRFLKNYQEIGDFYQALDLYIIASREEGGPKAVLESMASGVPLITTCVGQAMDLVTHGENAWMTEIEDYEELAHWSLVALENSELRKKVINNAYHTANENNYEAQFPLWQKFFKGFVEGNCNHV